MLGSLNSANASSQVSAIQLLNAANAFKYNAAITRPQPQEPITTEGTNLNDDNELLKGQDIDEIKKFAQMVQGTGENNLTEEDIKYGLSYGRSVIVEYMA